MLKLVGTGDLQTENLLNAKYESVLDEAIERCRFDDSYLRRLSLLDLQRLFQCCTGRIEIFTLGVRAKLRYFCSIFQAGIFALSDYDADLDLLYELRDSLAREIDRKKVINQRFHRFRF